MRDITDNAIVSASGYTRPAINKARAHGVALFELCDWDFSKEQFEHFKSQFCPTVQTTLEWVAPPSVKLNPGETFSEADQSFIKSNPKIYFGNDESKAEVPDLNCVLNNLRSQVQHQLFELLKDKAKADGTAINANVTATISDSSYENAFWKYRSQKSIVRRSSQMGRNQNAHLLQSA